MYMRSCPYSSCMKICGCQQDFFLMCLQICTDFLLYLHDVDYSSEGCSLALIFWFLHIRTASVTLHLGVNNLIRPVFKNT